MFKFLFLIIFGWATVEAVNLPLDQGFYKVTESTNPYCLGGKVYQEKNALIIGGRLIYSDINKGKVIDKAYPGSPSCRYETLTTFLGDQLKMTQTRLCPSKPIHFLTSQISFQKNQIRIEFTDQDQGQKLVKTRCILSRAP